jgi:hypothetical protein
MSKFIIEIRDGIGDYEAIEALLEVMNVGRISKNDTMYCYHTEMLVEYLKMIPCIVTIQKCGMVFMFQLWRKVNMEKVRNLLYI